MAAGPWPLSPKRFAISAILWRREFVANRDRIDLAQPGAAADARCPTRGVQESGLFFGPEHGVVALSDGA